MIPVLSRLVVTPRKARAILEALVSSVEPGEIVSVVALGWGILPVTRWAFAILDKVEKGGEGGERRSDEIGEEENSSSAAAAEDDDERGVGGGRGGFETTRAYIAARLSAQVFKIATAVYAVDCAEIALGAMGFVWADRKDYSSLFALVAYNVWATLRFKDFKRHLLERIFSSAQNKIGKVDIYDRILNTVVNTVMGVAILDILKVGRGTAIISSVLSLGGVGTLVFSLASKELAEQLVGGAHAVNVREVLRGRLHRAGGWDRRARHEDRMDPHRAQR